MHRNGSKFLITTDLSCINRRPDSIRIVSFLGSTSPHSPRNIPVKNRGNKFQFPSIFGYSFTIIDVLTTDIRWIFFIYVYTIKIFPGMRLVPAEQTLSNSPRLVLRYLFVLRRYVYMTYRSKGMNGM